MENNESSAVQQVSVSGCLFMEEVIRNTERKFGAATIYYPCFVQTRDGFKAALFTGEDIRAAMKRADANPEDLPKRSPWYMRIIHHVF